MHVTLDGIVFSIQRQGGISVYFRKLFESLEANKIESTLILEGKLKQQVFNSSPTFKIDKRSGRFMDRYRACNLTSNTSIFHSTYYRLPSNDSIPSVLTVYDFTYERFNKGCRRLVHVHQKHKAIKAAKVVICISEATKNDLLEYVGVAPGQEIFVVHLAGSVAYRPLINNNFAKPYILFVGERGGFKNFKKLVSSLNFLLDFELYCVGGGDLSIGEISHVHERVQSRIKHLGFIAEDVLNELYNNAVCLVYPSSFEGFGIPVIEAMMAGCPVVSISCDAVLEIGKNALTVANDDAESIANSVLKLMETPYRNKMVKNGFEVSAGYSWTKTHSKTIDIYKALVNGKSI